MELVNLVLMILLGTLSSVTAVKIINRLNNDNFFKTKNTSDAYYINNLINNNIKKCLKLRESFQNNPANAMKEQIENSKPSTTASSKPKGNPYGSITQDSDPCKRCSCDNSESLNNLIENLDNLELKCREYETKQETWDNDQKEKHEKIVKNQIELENKKINELKQIVNYYRRKYNEKLHINTKCRETKINVMNQAAESLSEINPDLIQQQDKKIDINISSLKKNN